MNKLRYVFSIIFVIILPLAVVSLSSNLVLRTSSVYLYHFNDSQVIDNIDYDISAADMSSDISSYLMSFSDNKFQVYEINGVYRDPVFTKTEQQVMSKARYLLNLTLGGGGLLALMSLVIYIVMLKKNNRDIMRKSGYAALTLTGVLICAQFVCVMMKSFRLSLYSSLIGINLAKDSTLAIILGDPFYKTFALFTTIVGAAILAVLIYINHKSTKPVRIFY